MINLSRAITFQQVHDTGLTHIKCSKRSCEEVRISSKGTGIKILMYSDFFTMVLKSTRNH